MSTIEQLTLIVLSVIFAVSIISNIGIIYEAEELREVCIWLFCQTVLAVVIVFWILNFGFNQALIGKGFAEYRIEENKKVLHIFSKEEIIEQYKEEEKEKSKENVNI